MIRAAFALIALTWTIADDAAAQTGSVVPPPRIARLPSPDAEPSRLLLSKPAFGPHKVQTCVTANELPTSTVLSRLPTDDTVVDNGWATPLPDWIAAAMIERANTSCDGQGYLSGFAARASQPELGVTTPHLTQLPAGYQPWWDGPVRNPVAAAVPLTVDHLVASALQYSSYIYVVSLEPRIRQTSVVEEQSAFDWRAFLETTYDDTNEPNGNELATGTLDDRYEDRTWITRGGLRRRNLLGGNVEMHQRVGGEQNNSQFLIPNPQSTTQLELRYTQPLLHGRGKCYNESRIVLAQLHTEISSDELAAALEDHLVQVTEAYWELYRARAEYFQRQKLIDSARTTLEIVEARADIDVERRQVLRTRAAVASRTSEIIRAGTMIRNAEAQLRLLVNDPTLVNAEGREFAPTEPPLMDALPVSMSDSLSTALQYRPDISRSIREVRAAATRLGVARNEVLPKLDFVASTYVAGLAGGTRVAESFGTQFDEGRPSYSVGLLFEMPLGNRGQLAQEERRRWELSQAMGQFRLVVEKGLTSVEQAVREVETTHGELLANYQAMVAVADEAGYLFDRWRTLPGADDSAILLLDNLLDAQERLAEKEGAVVRAQVGYAMAIIRLKQQLGTLLVVGPLGADVETGWETQPPEVIPLPPASPVIPMPNS